MHRDSRVSRCIAMVQRSITQIPLCSSFLPHIFVCKLQECQKSNKYSLYSGANLSCLFGCGDDGPRHIESCCVVSGLYPLTHISSLWSSSKGILGLLQAWRSCNVFTPFSLCSSLSRQSMNLVTVLLHVKIVFQNVLNWRRWNSQCVIYFVNCDFYVLEDKFLHSIHTFEPGKPLKNLYFSHCLLTKSRT